MKKLSNKKGFTLVELIVVMVILAILAVILIPRMANFQEDAKKTACQANLRSLNSITAMYILKNPGVSLTSTSINAQALVTDKLLLDVSEVRCPSETAPSKGSTSTKIVYDAPNGVWKCNTTGH